MNSERELKSCRLLRKEGDNWLRQLAYYDTSQYDKPKYPGADHSFHGVRVLFFSLQVSSSAGGQRIHTTERSILRVAQLQCMRVRISVPSETQCWRAKNTHHGTEYSSSSSTSVCWVPSSEVTYESHSKCRESSEGSLLYARWVYLLICKRFPRKINLLANFARSCKSKLNVSWNSSS